MMIPPAFFSPLPPPVLDDPVAYFISFDGLLICSLIFGEWFYTNTWVLYRGRAWRRENWQQPYLVTSAILWLIGLSGFVRNAPNVVSWGLWKSVSPFWRFELSHVDRLMDGASAPFMVVAALLVKWAGPVVIHQLRRKPIPLRLYLTWRRISRPVAVFGIATTLSCGIAFFA